MELYQETVGDKGQEMYELVGLSTAPHKQGRGYATALVRQLHERVSFHAMALVHWSIINPDCRPTQMVARCGWRHRMPLGSTSQSGTNLLGRGGSRRRTRSGMVDRFLFGL